jgi:hypothetical protein
VSVPAERLVDALPSDAQRGWRSFLRATSLIWSGERAQRARSCRPPPDLAGPLRGCSTAGVSSRGAKGLRADGSSRGTELDFSKRHGRLHDRPRDRSGGMGDP